MPIAEADLQSTPPLRRLPFLPVTRQHILHCSVHYWHPISLTPKTRLIPLTPAFVSYLGADGIVLPPDGAKSDSRESDADSWDGEQDTSEGEEDPSLAWPDVHESIWATIRELGGKVHPKLNWSAPKDATWIAATNSMECTSPGDICLLLKSSDFITHDLEQAFDDCADDVSTSAIPYHLVLRKSIPSIVTSMEFRCFVCHNDIIGICQRDLNHYDFLQSLVPTLQRLISDFFKQKLRGKFPDEDYVFDVYIPHPNESGRVWLIDINPWAPRTDPLLFSWMELLSIQSSTPTVPADTTASEGVISIEGDDGVVEELGHLAEFRIVHRDDPEAYSFNTTLYGAHKLPKDVVDAGMGDGGGISEFLSNWRNLQAEAEESRSGDSS